MSALPSVQRLSARRFSAGRLSALMVLAGLLAVPAATSNEFFLHTLCVALVYAVLAASWDFLFGFVGLISFGHAAFFGLGAYTAAIITSLTGLSPWAGPFIGGAAAAALGLLIGVPTLRLSAVFLALATLAVAESLRVVASNWHAVTRGTLGFNAHRTFFKLSGEAVQGYYAMLVAALLLIAAVYWAARRTRFGAILRAIRTDEIRAAALGIDVVRAKILAFMAAGFIAGAAGGLYAHYVGLVSPSELGASITMLVIAMATIGGAGTIIGPAAAAVVIYVIAEILRLAGSVYSQVAIGVVLMAFVLFLPDGIAGWFGRHPAAKPRAAADSNPANLPGGSST